jgi:hypothetical protein
MKFIQLLGSELTALFDAVAVIPVYVLTAKLRFLARLVGCLV